MVGSNPYHRFGLGKGDARVVHQLGGNPESSTSSALANTTLENVQTALFDCELNIAHVPVVALKAGENPV